MSGCAPRGHIFTPRPLISALHTRTSIPGAYTPRAFIAALPTLTTAQPTLTATLHALISDPHTPTSTLGTHIATLHALVSDPRTRASALGSFTAALLTRYRPTLFPAQDSLDACE